MSGYHVFMGLTIEAVVLQEVFEEKAANFCSRVNSHPDTGCKQILDFANSLQAER